MDKPHATRRTVTKSLGLLLGGGAATATASATASRTLTGSDVDPEAILPTANEVTDVQKVDTFPIEASDLADEMQARGWTMRSAPATRYFEALSAIGTSQMTGAAVWEFESAVPSRVELVELVGHLIEGWPEELLGEQLEEHWFVTGDTWIDSITLGRGSDGTYQEVMRLQVTEPFLFGIIAEGLLEDDETPGERVERHATAMTERANLQQS
jgi:hypothetical protein